MTTQLIYYVLESPITFGDSAQSPTVIITLANLSGAAGRISAQYDRGSSAKAIRYKWRATFQMNATAVVGTAIDLYIATSNGTNIDGELGTSDAAAIAAALPNLIYLGSAIVQVTTASTTFTASGVIDIPDRYISLVVYNRTAVALKNDTSINKFSLTPMAPQVQGAV